MIFSCSSKTNRFPKQLYPVLSHFKLKKLLQTQMHLANLSMGPENFVSKFEEYRPMRFVTIFYYSVFCGFFLLRLKSRILQYDKF